MDPIWTYMVTGLSMAALVIFLVYFVRHLSRDE